MSGGAAGGKIPQMGPAEPFHPPGKPWLTAALLVLAALPARSAPSMNGDFERMMGWLSNEVVQGLSFNAGSMFDPPCELRKWHIQPDVSLGLGSIPLNKGKFPHIETPALADKGPEKLLPNSVQFPNLALHLRMGLPGRFDFTLRGANMTVPKGYKLAKGTLGNGQSNSIGFSLRRHFLGGNDWPLVTVSGNYNHVKGHFNFLSNWQRVELTPGFQVDSKNTGRLEWNVNSLGVNTIMSQSYGIWTPFIGAGWNYLYGSMKARLQADFATPLIAPAIGEASDHPEQHQARVIVGTQLDRSRFSLFVNGEMKAIGMQAGKAFIIQLGVVTPFRIGSGSLVAKGTKRLVPVSAQLARDPGSDDEFDLDAGERIYLRMAPAPKPAKKKKRRAPEPEDEGFPWRRSSSWGDAGDKGERLYAPDPWDYRPSKRIRLKGGEPELILIK